MPNPAPITQTDGSHQLGIARGADLASLPPVMGLPAAARLLGIGRTTAYRLVRDGTWPTRVLRLGRQMRIPTAQIFDLLGHGPSARE